MRYAIILLSLFVSPQVIAQTAIWNGRAYSSRVCSNPNCAMCASIQAQLTSQITTVNNRTQVQIPEPRVETTDYELVPVQRAVTRQVKRCNGRTCWYETVTEYVTEYERRPVAKAVEASKPDLLTVTELAPTPPHVVLSMLASLNLRKGDRYYDLGCGDGRFLVEAAKQYQVSAIGIELNPESADLAKQRALDEFVAPLVTVIQGDIRQQRITSDAVTMYLYPELMEVVVPTLPVGTRIASYLHDIPGVDSTELSADGHVFYVGVKQ